MRLQLIRHRLQLRKRALKEAHVHSPEIIRLKVTAAPSWLESTVYLLDGYGLAIQPAFSDSSECTDQTVTLASYDDDQSAGAPFQGSPGKCTINCDETMGASASGSHL